VEGRILEGFSDEDIENQLRATCLRAERDVWPRLLPNDDDDESLLFNTGQYWEPLYLCLHKAGFVSKSKVNGKVREPLLTMPTNGAKMAPSQKAGLMIDFFVLFAISMPSVTFNYTY